MKHPIQAAIERKELETLREIRASFWRLIGAEGSTVALNLALLKGARTYGRMIARRG